MGKVPGPVAHRPAPGIPSKPEIESVPSVTAASASKTYLGCIKSSDSFGSQP